MRHADTALTATGLVAFALYMAIQAFTHPEWTRTQLFLENWVVCVSVALALVTAVAVEWMRQR